MERYAGQIQTWTDHHGRSERRGAIYDTSRPRGSVGDLQHDFAFVEFTDVDMLADRVAELNRYAATAASLEA